MSEQENRISIYKVEVVCLDCRKVLKSEETPMAFIDALALAEAMEHDHVGHALNRQVEEVTLD